MSKITYDNKVATKPQGVRVNQFWDADANEIKTVVNEHDDRIEDLENIYGALYIGEAYPETNPTTPENNSFYTLSVSGEYTHFGLTIVDGESAIALYSDGSWGKIQIAFDSNYEELIAMEGSIQADGESLNLRNGRQVECSATNDQGSEMQIYLIKSDGTSVYKGGVDSTPKIIDIDDTYTIIRYYSIDGVGDVAGTARFISAIEDLQEDVADINEMVLDETIDMSGSNSVQVSSDRLKNGVSVNISGTNSGGAAIECYLYREAGTFEFYGNVESEVKTIVLEEDFFSIRYYSVSGSITGEAVVLSELSAIAEKAEQGSALGMSAQRILVLGDSYSEGTPVWLEDVLSKLPEDSSYISLAVGGATVKDKYEDRVTYPYTSRPINSVSTGNLNTLSCQIEKLERLMTGTDLDTGETQIYQTEDSYPTLIILEGGMNDGTDNQTKEDDYIDQVIEIVQAWRKLDSESTPAIGDVAILPDIETIDRVSFCGAYRYLADKLIEKFPDAVIMITTASPISYFNYDYITQRLTIANQQRLCSDLLSLPLIDWHRDGRINHINVQVKGGGTEVDPYIWDNTSDNRLSNDGLHPNSDGALYYSNVAYNEIVNTLKKH